MRYCIDRSALSSIYAVHSMSDIANAPSGGRSGAARRGRRVGQPQIAALCPAGSIA